MRVSEEIIIVLSFLFDPALYSSSTYETFILTYFLRVKKENLWNIKVYVIVVSRDNLIINYDASSVC